MNDSLKRKLQKLMARAMAKSNGDSCLENEADSARALAEDLLRAHGLMWSDISMDDPCPIEQQLVSKSKAQGGNEWRMILANGVSGFLGCAALITTDGNKIYMVGRKTDLDAAQYMFLAITNQLEGDATRAWDKLKSRPHHARKRWMRSFLVHASKRIATRMRISRDDAREMSPVNEQLSMVKMDQGLEEFMGRFAERRETVVVDSSHGAAEAGVAAGNRILLETEGILESPRDALPSHGHAETH